MQSACQISAYAHYARTPVLQLKQRTGDFSNCQLDNHSSISIPGHQKLPTWIHQLHQLYQLSYQSCNWQLPVSKLSTGQSLLYFYPGASETANLTNFANWVAKVATDNSQFPNCQCQLKYLRKSALVNSTPKYSLQPRSGCLGKAPLCV